VPSGGEDLSRPPVRVWNRAAAAQLATMLAGCNLYSMGAGGFSSVPAIPQMVRLKQPARPGRPADIRATQLYTTFPYPTKQQIAQRFGRI
jgi:hypothetical protein